MTSASSDVLARCESVGRTFGSGSSAVVAVQAASCTVRSGDRIVITGASGSGKTTLLHLIAGLETATSGAVEWPGLGGPQHLRPLAVAMIFQGPSLLPPLDVLENVALPQLLGGAAPADAAAWALAALRSLGLSALAAKLPEELSGGQAQRVAVARVLAGRPRLVLADEPTGQLDRAGGERMLDVLDAAIADLGAALMVTTHDRGVASRYPTRWSMVDGRLDTAA